VGHRLTHRLTLLCQRLRYLKPLQELHLCPAETEITIASCTSTRDIQHLWVLCTFPPTRMWSTSTASTHKLQHQLSTTNIASSQISANDTFKKDVTGLSKLLPPSLKDGRRQFSCHKFDQICRKYVKHLCPKINVLKTRFKYLSSDINFVSYKIIYIFIFSQSYSWEAKMTVFQGRREYTTKQILTFKVSRVVLHLKKN
jgi:hypothetical protein